MSDYSDCYDSEYSYEIEREIIANNYRRRLINEISRDDMIKIMFTDYIKKQENTNIIKIGEEYLK